MVAIVLRVRGSIIFVFQGRSNIANMCNGCAQMLTTVQLRPMVCKASHTVLLTNVQGVYHGAQWFWTTSNDAWYILHEIVKLHGSFLPTSKQLRFYGPERTAKELTWFSSLFQWHPMNSNMPLPNPIASPQSSWCQCWPGLTGTAHTRSPSPAAISTTTSPGR